MKDAARKYRFGPGITFGRIAGRRKKEKLEVEKRKLFPPGTKEVGEILRSRYGITSARVAEILNENFKDAPTLSRGDASPEDVAAYIVAEELRYGRLL